MSKRLAKKRRRKNEDDNDEFQVVSCKLRRTVHAASGVPATSYVRCGNKVDTFANRKRKSEKKKGEEMNIKQDNRRVCLCTGRRVLFAAAGAAVTYSKPEKNRPAHAHSRRRRKRKERAPTKKKIFTISQFNFRYMKAFPFVFCSQT